MKCIIDGKMVPPVFAPSLFKYLVGKRPTLLDLEVYDPNLALKLRFQLAEEEKFTEVEAKIEEVLVKRIEPQLVALRQGFLEFDISRMVLGFSDFDLSVLSLTPGFCDTISSDLLRRSITFCGYPEGSQTPNHVNRFLGALTPYGLRMFLYFATSRCTLATGSTLPVLLRSLVFNQDTTKILIHSTPVSSSRAASVPVKRTFAFQLEVPNYGDYTIAASSIMSAMIQFCSS